MEMVVTKESKDKSEDDFVIKTEVNTHAIDTGIEDDIEYTDEDEGDKTEPETVDLTIESDSEGKSDEESTSSDLDEDEIEQEEEGESGSDTTMSVMSDNSNDVQSIYSALSVNRVEGQNVLATAGSGIAFLLLMSFITGIIEIIIYRNSFKIFNQTRK